MVAKLCPGSCSPGTMFLSSRFVIVQIRFLSCDRLAALVQDLMYKPMFITCLRCEFGSLVLPVGRRVQEEYGMRDAMQGLSQMDLRSQELQDMEVARRLQEEELKVPYHFYISGKL